MATHALLSPSSAHRWMKCTGSVVGIADLPRSSSEHSDRGTATHFLAADVLISKDKVARDYLDLHILVDKKGDARFLKEDESVYVDKEVGRVFRVDQAMAECVQTYVDYCNSIPGVQMVEVPLPLESITGEEQAFGTGDCLKYHSEEKTLHCIDLKSGAGIWVEVNENKQLILYSLGALSVSRMLGEVQKVIVHIVQPPRDNIAHVEFTIEELDAHRAEIRARALEAWAVINDDSGLVVYNPGDWCQFCRKNEGDQVCPGVTEQALAMTLDSFPDLTAPVKDQKAAAKGVAISYDLETLEKAYDALKWIGYWADAVKQAMKAKVTSGECTKYKFVKARSGARMFKDPAQAVALAKKMKMKKEAYTVTALKTPAQLEAAYKEGLMSEYQWKKLSALMPAGEDVLSLVPQSDARPAVKPVLDDFKNLDTSK